MSMELITRFLTGKQEASLKAGAKGQEGYLPERRKDMPDYEGFVKQLKAQVSGRLGEGCRICVRKTGKVNRGMVDALHICSAGGSGDSAVPVFYPEMLFGRYQDGEGIGEIAESIAGAYLAHREDAEQVLQQAADISSYGKMKGRLYFRLINTGKNRELLEGVPHSEVMDLSMVFYVLLSGDDSGIRSVMVDSRLMELWGITAEELEEQARMNAPGILPAKVETVEHVLQGIWGIMSGMEGDSPWGKEAAGPFILTNNRMVNGFATVLYPGALKDMADILGEDLYVLPSSVHEALLLPAASFLKPGELQNMVREVNASAVAEEDILSDSVYYYDRKEDALRIIGEER